MLTHFKSLILTSDNIEKCIEEFQELFGQDVSRLIVDNDSRIYKHHLKNGSLELCESNDDRDLFYFKKLKKYNQNNGIQALSLISDNIVDDHNKFKEMESHLNNINLKNIVEMTDETDLKDQAACAGGACEIV